MTTWRGQMWEISQDKWKHHFYRNCVSSTNNEKEKDEEEEGEVEENRDGENL